MSTGPRLVSKLARGSARAFFIAGLLAGLAGCTLWVGATVPSLPATEGWQILPLRAFLTRDTIHADAMQFCRAASCGYDSAIGVFTARGREVKALEAMLADPAGLRRAIAKPRLSPKRAPAHVSVDKIALSSWSGVKISILGAPGGKQAFGVILERRRGDRATFVVSVAKYADLALRLAEEAAQ